MVVLLEFALRAFLVLAELAVLLVLLDGVALAVAGAPVDGSPVLSAVEVLGGEALVLSFCAQGGRFGSSCPRSGRFAANRNSAAHTSGRKCHSLRCATKARR